MTEILYSYHEPIHSVTRLVSCKKTSYGGEEVETEREMKYWDVVYDETSSVWSGLGSIPGPSVTCSLNLLMVFESVDNQPLNGFTTAKFN